MPEVSVVVPNFNHAAFLKERLDSVFNQSFTDFEVIILDDASSDNSRELINSYKTHPKVSQVIFNEKNSGSSFAQWNKGVQLAVGNYIWIAESDDFAETTFLEKAMSRMKSEKVQLVYANSHMVNEKSEVIGNLDWWHTDLHPDLWSNDFRMKGSAFRSKYLSIKNAIMNASSVVFLRQRFLNMGMANERMKLCGDWDCWARFLAEADVAFIQDRLNYYRFHANTVRDRPNNASIIYRESLYVRLSILKTSAIETLALNRSARETLLNLKSWAIQKGKIAGAIVMLMELVKMAVDSPKLVQEILLLILHDYKVNRR